MSEECPQLPGSLVQINIPAGAVVNLLNVVEVTSPGGICLIIRIPLLGDDLEASGVNNLGTVIEMVKKAKAMIDIIH